MVKTGMVEYLEKYKINRIAIILVLMVIIFALSGCIQEEQVFSGS
jgi:hypothetical protein